MSYNMLRLCMAFIVGLSLIACAEQAGNQPQAQPSAWFCNEGESENNACRNLFSRKVPGGTLWMVTTSYGGNASTALVFQPDELAAEKAK